MPTTKINARIEQHLVDYLGNLGYESFTHTLEMAITGYAVLRKKALNNLRGHFTRAEWTAMLAMQNALFVTAESQVDATQYLQELRDYEAMEQGVSVQGANYDELVGKLKALDTNTIYFLQEEARRYWVSGAFNGDIEKFFRLHRVD